MSQTRSLGMNNMYWIFGRGMSLACKLSWDVREIAGFVSKNRTEQIKLICASLNKAQQSRVVDIGPYRRMFDLCDARTTAHFKHTFSTLNWDTLAEIAIKERRWKILPRWITGSHIFHWNGTIEEQGRDQFISNRLLRRSPFILPSDEADFRKKSLEGNTAFAKMGWTHVLAICGVSFMPENKCDETLIKLIEWVHDDLPIGECHCFIINNSSEAISRTKEKLEKFLWRKIIPICRPLDEWVRSGCPELETVGVLQRIK